MNPTDQVAAVTLTAYGSDGRPLAASGLQNPVPLTIAANQQTAKLTSELFGSGVDPSAVAWFQATSSVDGLAGFFLFLNGSITVFDGADLPESAPAVIFNLVRQDLGFSTELNIVNPGCGRVASHYLFGRTRAYTNTPTDLNPETLNESD